MAQSFFVMTHLIMISGLLCYLSERQLSLDIFAYLKISKIKFMCNKKFHLRMPTYIVYFDTGFVGQEKNSIFSIEFNFHSLLDFKST